MRPIQLFLILVFFTLSKFAAGAEITPFQQCILDRIDKVAEQTSVVQIKQYCEQQILKKTLLEETLFSDNDAKPAAAKTNPAKPLGAISSRLLRERQAAFDPYTITPHKMNYILPALFSNRINSGAYEGVEGWSENLTDVEAKFQLSLKVPLTYTSTFIPGDAFYFGFTIEAWWQIYADQISKPFRETNYQPELFYLAPLGWHPFGGNTGFSVGVEHQSNGRSQLLSRSWNRAYVNLLYEKNNFALSFRSWWRLPEDEKEFELDPQGDDNPDIDVFMGHFELGAVYQWRQYEFSALARQNFAEHKGAIELGLTFPIWGRLQGYAQFFNGYGESLIDYNYQQSRFGVGIALTDFL